MSAFLDKLKKLPPEVQAYLLAMKSSELNVFISQAAGLSGSQSSDMTDLISAVFFKEINVVDLPAECVKRFSLSPEKAKQLAVSIAGIRLLPVDSWLSGSVSQFLINNGEQVADYKNYLEQQKAALVEEEKYFTEELKPAEPYVYKPKKQVPSEPTPAEEKEAAVEMFGTKLTEVFKLSDGLYLDDYNHLLIAFIAEDEEFRRRLERALVNSQEILSDKKIELDGAPASGTIANFIKDYIKKCAGRDSDEILLAEYLSASPNLKFLDSSAKNMVRKAIRLYHNLLFFPDSMAGVHEDKWELFPVDTRTAEFEDVLTDEPARIDKPLEKYGADEAGDYTNPGGAGDPFISELESALKKYAPSSLEYKAINQEIKKLKSR